MRAPSGRFFLPGPTEVRPAVRRAMSRPLISHRSAEFRELFARVQKGLRYVFRTKRPVFVSTSSATGLMEAGVRCAPEGRMLALVNGAFSERFTTIAHLTGRECDLYEVPPGEVHDPGEVARHLRRARYAVVTVVHSETSTGALNEVRAITTAAHEYGAACVVDSVSGIGGVPFDFDEWEIDFALTGSQKALALPPGLAFAAATESFTANAKSVGGRGLYFDLVEHEAMVAKNETPNTPAVSLLYALDVQLAAIMHEGLGARWARHAAMRDVTETWVMEVRRRTGVDMTILARPGNRAATVTAVQLPPPLSGSALAQAVAKRGYTIGTGYRALGDTAIRIGHMGDHTVPALKRCLNACEAALLDLLG